MIAGIIIDGSHTHPLQTRSTRSLLCAALKVGVRVANRAGDGVESKACGLGGELRVVSMLSYERALGDDINEPGP